MIALKYFGILLVSIVVVLVINVIVSGLVLDIINMNNAKYNLKTIYCIVSSIEVIIALYILVSSQL